MEEEKDGGGWGAGGAVEDAGAGREGDVVDFDGGAGHDVFFFVFCLLFGGDGWFLLRRGGGGLFSLRLFVGAV